MTGKDLVQPQCCAELIVGDANPVKVNICSMTTSSLRLPATLSSQAGMKRPEFCRRQPKSLVVGAARVKAALAYMKGT